MHLIEGYLNDSLNSNFYAQSTNKQNWITIYTSHSDIILSLATNRQNGHKALRN